MTLAVPTETMAPAAAPDGTTPEAPEPPAPPAPDPGEFREAMGVLPTGVTIITTLDEDGSPRGFTANAVTSLSVEPPLLLVCVKKDAATHAVLAAEAPFTVNILGRNHEELALRFAKPGAPSFPDAEFACTDAVPPVVHDALAVVACHHYATIDGGDHSIVLGHVVDTELHGGEPLVFHERGFHHIPSS